MSPSPQNPTRKLFPPMTCCQLALSWAVVVAFLIYGESWLGEPIATPVAIASFVMLFSTILFAAFGVVREADVLAHSLGEPYGTLILTLTVVGIEIILILAVMVGPGEASTIARDSIFAVMMIIMNLVTGTCLLVGGLRYGEQEYNAQGAVAYLSMIVLLTGTALVLPNAIGTGDGTFGPVQAATLGGLTTILYGVFLAMQMKSYRRFFVQPKTGSMVVPVRSPDRVIAEDQDDAQTEPVDGRVILIRSVILFALIVPIILLAHDLAILIDLGVEQAGLPVAVGGVLIATIVFTPESMTAVKASLANQMQRVINLCHGAFLSTVGLTVPAVLAIGLIMNKTVVLGLNAVDTVLLALTLALSALSFIGLRTSPLQGLMHLMLFAVYLVLLFFP